MPKGVTLVFSASLQWCSGWWGESFIVLGVSRSQIQADCLCYDKTFPWCFLYWRKRKMDDFSLKSKRVQSKPGKWWWTKWLVLGGFKISSIHYCGYNLRNCGKRGTLRSKASLMTHKRNLEVNCWLEGTRERGLVETCSFFFLAMTVWWINGKLVSSFVSL